MCRISDRYPPSAAFTMRIGRHSHASMRLRRTQAANSGVSLRYFMLSPRFCVVEIGWQTNRPVGYRASRTDSVAGVRRMKETPAAQTLALRRRIGGLG